MKRIVTGLMLCMICTISVAQQTTFLVLGKVIDSATQQPLAGASALCQNTTYGTISNAEGHFGLRLPNGGYDLVISYTGYEKKSIRLSNTQMLSDTMVISLTQVDKTLAEVAVVASNEVTDGWEKYGKFFSDNFIGTTPNSAQCTIENPQVLKFYFTKNKKRHRLKVMSTDEILIRNNSLGYLLKYQLDSFTYDYVNNIFQYTGYPFFIELDTIAEVKEQWMKNRARTYLGSRVHFMKSLYDSTVNQEGFMVEKLEGPQAATEITNLYDSSLYLLDSNTVTVNWTGRYRVSYKRVMPDKKFLAEFNLPASSRMQVTILDVSDNFVVEQNGFFYEQSDLVNTGYWAWKKLAELLPYDYNYH